MTDALLQKRKLLTELALAIPDTDSYHAAIKALQIRKLADEIAHDTQAAKPAATDPATVHEQLHSVG